MSDLRAMDEYRAKLDEAGRAELDKLERDFWKRRELARPHRWELWTELRRLRRRYAQWLAMTHGEIAETDYWIGCSPAGWSFLCSEHFGREVHVRNLSSARFRFLAEWDECELPSRVHIAVRDAEPCTHDTARWCQAHAQVWCPRCGALGVVSLLPLEGAVQLSDELHRALLALDTERAWVTWTLPRHDA